MEGVDYDHKESILEKVSDTWWLSHATCNFMLCYFVYEYNKDIFTHAAALPAGKIRENVRLDTSESVSEAHTVAKASRLVDEKGTY